MKELLSHTHVSKNDFIVNLETVLTILTFYSYNTTIFILLHLGLTFSPMLLIKQLINLLY